MPKVATGFKSLSTAVKATTHADFINYCRRQELSINQMLKALVLERTGKLHKYFWQWSIDEQRAYLRGR